MYRLVGVPGVGGTLICSYIHRLGPFLGFKILNFNFLGGLQKKWIFIWRMKILWIFVGGHHRIGF